MRRRREPWMPGRIGPRPAALGDGVQRRLPHCCRRFPHGHRQAPPLLRFVDVCAPKARTWRPAMPRTPANTRGSQRARRDPEARRPHPVKVDVSNGGTDPDARGRTTLQGRGGRPASKTESPAATLQSVGASRIGLSHGPDPRRGAQRRIAVIRSGEVMRRDGRPLPSVVEGVSATPSRRRLGGRVGAVGSRLVVARRGRRRGTDLRPTRGSARPQQPRRSRVPCAALARTIRRAGGTNDGTQVARWRDDVCDDGRRDLEPVRRHGSSTRP